SASVIPVNSRMSAPAMKPLFLAEITTSARGGCFSSPASSPSSSTRTLPESTLAEVPGLSSVSQATPSASFSRLQLRAVSLLMLELSGDPGAPVGSGAAARVHQEVAHQRAMIGQAHVGHAEARDLDALTHEHEVELDARHACREGEQSRGIGAAQARGTHEQ